MVLSIAFGGKMICYHDKVLKQEISAGILLQELGTGKNMNVLHWNMEDKSVVAMHVHPQEQFGYVIKGGFDMIIDGKNYSLRAGDAYFIPPDVPHSFTAVGETEAIDVFNPVKTDYPWKN